MEANVKGLVMGVIGILVLALVINIAIGIWQPTAIKNAVKATTSYNQTIDGVTYQFDGTGDSAQQAGQDAQDNVNTVRTVANVLLGLVFLVLIVLSAISLFGGKKHY